MRKPSDPRELAIDLLPRSVCNVQVAAVIVDHGRICGWGWNSLGPTGLGLHAEHHACTRVSKERAIGGIIYVAAKRRKNSKIVTARPCLDCFDRIRAMGLDHIWYRDAEGQWIRLYY